MSTVEKRIREADLTDLAEPQMTDEDWDDFYQGIVLFNRGKFWESHEAWEAVWMRHSENSRIFFQGLIQVAAALHQLDRSIYHGVEKHLRNAQWKLEPFQPTFLRIDVKQIVDFISKAQKQLQKLGKHNLHDFDVRIIPKIKKLNELK